jgi:hypothetical protein
MSTLATMANDHRRKFWIQLAIAFGHFIDGDRDGTWQWQLASFLGRPNIDDLISL